MFRGAGGKITISGEQANDHGSEQVSGKSSENIEADDFYFGPTVLTGKPDRGSRGNSGRSAVVSARFLR